jgi:hypothetical protein
MNSKDDNNSGRLFKNSDDWTIIQQGKLIIENTEQRIIGVKRLNKDGKPIVELYRAIGTLKSNEDKQSEKSPDAKGVINKLLDKGALTISAWKETSEKGNAYTSLKCREFSNDYNQDDKSKEEVTNQTVGEDLDDEIPW